MNTVISSAVAHVGSTGILGATTVVFLVCFTGWTVWAWHPSRRAAMDAASQLPFEDDSP
jgi:cbb3-type cytochrome oxidase subunit 3